MNTLKLVGRGVEGLGFASAIALIYFVGLAILPFAPETKGQPLPE